jgi:pimeloyl-ACP methyl ester carboxylesterase
VAGPPEITLPDGRALAYSEIGDADGYPVVWCHGGLSSRLDAENARAGALAAKVRLIAPDRPGIDRSARKKDRTIAEWGDDVGSLADALSLDRFGVLGWSAGGPHALACAAAMPERVAAVATIGSMAPVRGKADRKELGLRLDRTLIPLCRRAPWLAWLAFRVTRGQKPEKAKKALLKELGDADRRVLEPLPATRISDPYKAALSPGPNGLIDDYRAVGAPEWGFELSAVSQNVRLWQGEDDQAVPMSIAERLAGSLPHAELTRVPDAGHFLVLEHGGEIFEALRGDAGA